MQRFLINTYVKRISGKPVNGIIQNKAYKVEYSSNRWVKLYGIKNKYSTKYFTEMEQTDILKQHLDQWKPIQVNSFTDRQSFPDRIVELCKLAYAHKAGDFLTEAIMKGLIK